MNTVETIGLMVFIGIICLAIYYRFGQELRSRAKSRSERREQFGEDYDRFKDGHNNPLIPDFLEMHPGRSVALIFVFIVLLIIVSGSVVTVPAGHRGCFLLGARWRTGYSTRGSASSYP
jgi:hypothetical protein